ncbi:hypothetical protein HYH03_017992 [Edaphochlamys debaryana]|uniref:Uncharacterized protein n=1 Tax=Edaphochlamys debaryana TaxID=47281 RepID=A0A836BND6_9CHLO|nr:hypothetical protein HYH03_017992 [Edaphochlamys debaryana]|eukprot:KAG2483146.1 hypothetical protein HYH03_017992 [Edaphochlamys debaryana]
MAAAVNGSGSGGAATSAETADLVNAQSAALQAISAITSIAAASASVLSDSTKDALLSAAKSAAVAMAAGGSSGAAQTGTDFVTNICQLLGLSIPAGTSSSGRRRALLDSGSTAVAAAEARLTELLSVADKLGDALGRQAVPGGSPVAAGSNGVFVSAAALKPAAAGGSTSATLAAGPTAAAGGSSANGNNRRRRLLGGTSTDAVAQLVVGGTAAASASGWGVDLSYSTTAQASLATALGGLLPAGSVLLNGLAALSWNAGAGAGSIPPALDGASSYVLLSLPAAAGYDSARPTACLQYDSATGKLTGSLAGLPGGTGASPAAFVSYDTTTALVTCRPPAALRRPSPAQPPPPAPRRPPAPASRAVVLTVRLRMGPAQVASSAGLLAFRAALQQALASAMQLPASAVAVTSLDATTLPDAVGAVVQLTLPPAAPATDTALAALQAKPMATLPAAFLSDYGVTDASVDAGVTTLQPFPEVSSNPSASPSPAAADPSTSPSPSPAAGQAAGGQGDKVPEGVIIGAVWGGMAFLVVLTAVWAFWYLRHHHRVRNAHGPPGEREQVVAVAVCPAAHSDV